MELVFELDFDDVCELDWEIWVWVMWEVEVGWELDEVCFCIEFVFVILDRGVKMFDDWENENE